MADFVLLSTADWDHPLWTNKQHTALSLAAAGHRILYVDSLGLRVPRPNASDFGRIFKRLGRMLRPPRRLSERLWVFSPVAIPGATSGPLLKLNRWILQFSLSFAQYTLGFRKPVLWTYNPLAKDYLELDTYQSVIYHCVDRIQAQPGMPHQIIDAAERDLCTSADMVFTTSPELQNSVKPFNHHTYFFGNVADAKHFAQAIDGFLPCPPELAGINHPRIIFVGAIDAYKLDLSMLLDLVRSTPEWNYIFVGPVGEGDPATDVLELQACHNMHFLGYRPYQVLPSWFAHVDIAILPLRVNNYTNHMFPMKFFEYLASGIPVVATRVPSLELHAKAAHLCAPNAAEFQHAIQQALSGLGPSLADRLASAVQHTYEQRTRDMLDLLIHHHLLPLDGPTFLRPSLLIGKPPNLSPSVAERLLARCALSITLASASLLSPQQSAVALAFWAKLWPHNPLILQSLSLRYLLAGDYVAARHVMEDLWESCGDLHQLHRLLFRRSARPQEPFQQIALFDALGASQRLPFSYCCYSQIVSAYRCIDAHYTPGMRRLRDSLSVIASILEQDPETRSCGRENRVNRSKLLVSAYTTMARLCLAIEDFEAYALVGRRASDFMDSFNLEAIDPDTSYRLTRNLMRCLAIEVLEAWRTDDLECFDHARSRIARVHAHCHLESFNNSLAQEDHRGFAEEFLSEIDSLRVWIDSSAKNPGQIHRVLQLMINSKKKPIKSLVRLFAPYLSSEVEAILA